MPSYFPVALRLEGCRCLVVGGGAVAARRIASLLEVGADVTVIAPTACVEISKWAEAGRIRYMVDVYRPDYLEGVFLVVAATNRPEVNAAVAADARKRGVLCNDTEDSERGNCVVPAVVRRGDLLLAVTTGGRSPALAARIQNELEATYGPEYGPYVELLGDIRKHVLEASADAAKRRAALQKVVDDREVLALIRQGRREDALAKALSCISSLLD